jgi:hypothetical protein
MGVFWFDDYNWLWPFVLPRVNVDRQPITVRNEPVRQPEGAVCGSFQRSESRMLEVLKRMQRAKNILPI